MNNKISETLKSADNEGTESPYWLLIDPICISGQLRFSKDDDHEVMYTVNLDDDDVIERIERDIPNCVTGPFFSREDANEYLKRRRYAYSDKAYIYCHSGYWSNKYKEFYREIIKDLK